MDLYVIATDGGVGYGEEEEEDLSRPLRSLALRSRDSLATYARLGLFLSLFFPSYPSIVELREAESLASLALSQGPREREALPRRTSGGAPRAIRRCGDPRVLAHAKDVA